MWNVEVEADITGLLIRAPTSTHDKEETAYGRKLLQGHSSQQ